MKTSHAAAPAANSKTRKIARKTPATPKPFFRLVVRLRRAILLRSTLHSSKIQGSPLEGLPTIHCTGNKDSLYRFYGSGGG
jgi:hypothetical protein